MSDKPSIQIDSDWKRQAQEEKRKLAEQEAEARAKREAAAAPARPATTPGAQRLPQMPPPSFATILQSMATQALFYMGELAQEGEQPMLSLDMARHYIDSVSVLEAKTKGNLAPDEQSLLDQTLYDLRSRFVGIARQMIQ